MSGADAFQRTAAAESEIILFRSNRDIDMFRKGILPTLLVKNFGNVQVGITSKVIIFRHPVAFINDLIYRDRLEYADFSSCL
jgi:hypothetical protein